VVVENKSSGRTRQYYSREKIREENPFLAAPSAAPPSFFSFSRTSFSFARRADKESTIRRVASPRESVRRSIYM